MAGGIHAPQPRIGITMSHVGVGLAAGAAVALTIAWCGFTLASAWCISQGYIVLDDRQEPPPSAAEQQ